MTREEAIRSVIYQTHARPDELVRMFGGTEEEMQKLIDEEHRKVIEGYELNNNILWCDCSVCKPTNEGREGMEARSK